VAAHSETGASSPGLEFTGWDWVGRVSLDYSPPSLNARNRLTDAQLSMFRFANGCDQRGSRLKVAINVAPNKLFHYRGRGFTISGNVIGSHDGIPREIAGTASFSGHGCSSGPWWFEVWPPQ